LTEKRERVALRFRSTWEEVPYDGDGSVAPGETEYDTILKKAELRARWWSEDYGFCRDLWRHKIPVLLDPSMRVGHEFMAIHRPTADSHVSDWMTLAEYVQLVGQASEGDVDAKDRLRTLQLDMFL
jgi:hypothetical protein